MDYLKRIAEILESGELVSFGFSDKYITVDKLSFFHVLNN